MSTPVAFADSNVQDQSNLINSIQFYVDLLAFQYTVPTNQAWMAILAKQALGDMFISQIGEAFDLKTAVGAQLDILGKYIGLGRDILVPTGLLFFGFVNTPGGLMDNDNGFRQPSDPTINPSDLFYRGNQELFSLVSMTDAQYRLMLQVKVCSNNSIETIPDAEDLLYQVWPAGSGSSFEIVDNEDMTMTYNITAFCPFASLAQGEQMLASVLPKPIAVGITVNWNEPDYTRVLVGSGPGLTRVLQSGDTRVIQLG